MFVDLHLHSNASDGEYSPSEVVKRVKNAGVEYMALTDHDTICGLDEAIKKGKEIGINVINGIEISAKEHKNMHILGLGFSHNCFSLINICDIMRHSRNERKYHIIDFLKKKGVYISLEDVEELANGATIGRPHFAQIMLKYGYVKSIREAFDLYLDTEDYNSCVKQFKFNVENCINAIHESGGKAVLAHPYQLKYNDEKLDSTIKKLKEYGLDGLEVYYTRHTDKDIKQYLELIDKYKLHMTAGSDFHGECVKPDFKIMVKDLNIEWIFM